MLYLLLVTYSTVFVAEIIGDKSIYTISDLASRFRPLPVFCGLTTAFMGKMLAAVLIGQAIVELPAALVAGASAATFFIASAVIWLKSSDGDPAENKNPKYWSRALLSSFAVVFFSEWADIGQITAATMVARYKMPLIVWAGATLALMSKGLIAMTLGLRLRKHVSRHVLRLVGISLYLVMGALSVLSLI